MIKLPKACQGALTGLVAEEGASRAGLMISSSESMLLSKAGTGGVCLVW